jgi:hypothetical protein
MQTSDSTREALKAAAILGLLIVLIFGDVVFLGYTLSPALWNYGILGSAYRYQGRWLQWWIYGSTVMDPLATGGQNWPIYELISRTLFSGHLPLWNPYQGTGAPLAADTSWSTYFPVNILYVLPNQYWDFVWFFKVWLAGIICYIFLKKLGLAHVPAIGGSLAYCLSGAFIFYPFLPWTDVAILTPALLLVAKNCFDEPSARHTLALGGGVFAISILGAHIETLVIQFFYVNLFVLFEAITRKKERVRGVAIWAGVVLLGLGLASFFLFPVFEYLREATLGHGANVGPVSLSTDGWNPAISWVTLFIPYFYGFVKTYPYDRLAEVFLWDISPGYLGIGVFFLSLLPLFSIRGNWIPRKSKYFVFFIIAATLILMKVFGVPPVNWIGFLPVLNSVDFVRFSGSVLALSLAGACAFGLESVLRSVRRSSVTALFAVLIAVGPAALTTVPSPVSPNNPFFPVSLAYLALGVFYLFLCFCMVSRGGVESAKVLVALIVLELVSYIPRSLAVTYEAIRVAILAGAALVLVGSQLKWFRFLKVSGQSRRVSLPTFLSRNRAFAIIIIAALVLQFVVAGMSPVGLPNRYDPFTEAPYVRFLQANTGYQRVYSLDGVLFPPVAALFTIQHLGEFSAFMPASFRNFSLTNLDRGAAASTLSGNAWARNEKYNVSSEINENLPFYSLLGVKYFVTAYTVLDNLPVIYHDQNVTIYQNLRAFPRAFLTNQIVQVSNEEEAVLKTRDLGWDTRETLVIEGNSASRPTPVNASKSGSIVGSAEIEQYSPSEIRIHVDAPGPSFLVLTDTFYPGWRAYVDGKPETISRAYGVVRAIFVNADSHEVIFSYEPESFRIGSTITLVSALVVIIIYSAELRSKSARTAKKHFGMIPRPCP